MKHVLKNHAVERAVSIKRTTFQGLMSPKGIDRAHGATSLSKWDHHWTDHASVRMRGQANGLTIEMWVNRETKEIETAYPVTK